MTYSCIDKAVDSAHSVYVQSDHLHGRLALSFRIVDNNNRHYDDVEHTLELSTFSGSSFAKDITLPKKGFAVVGEIIARLPVLGLHTEKTTRLRRIGLKR